MRRILFVITVLLTACTTTAPLPTVAPMPTANPYATWTPTPGMGAQGVIIRQTELAFQQTRGAYEAGVAQATQSYQLTKDAQAIKERELMLRVTEQSITQQAQQNQLAFEITRANATEQARAKVIAQTKAQDDDNWWWWVKSLGAIVIIGEFGWVILQVGEAWRWRVVNDPAKSRLLRTGNIAILLNSNGTRESMLLEAPKNVDDEMGDAEPYEESEQPEAVNISRNEVVYSSAKKDRTQEEQWRTLGLRWLNDAIKHSGEHGAVIPRYERMGWYSEDWQRAKRLFDDQLKVQKGVGTFVSGRYGTLGELRQAVFERRYQPRPTVENAPPRESAYAESGVL